MCYQGMPILESGESRALWKAFTVLKRGPLVSSDSALGMVMRAGGAETPSHGWLTHLPAVHPIAPAHSSEVLNCETDDIWWFEGSVLLRYLLQSQASKSCEIDDIWEIAFKLGLFWWLMWEWVVPRFARLLASFHILRMISRLLVNTLDTFVLLSFFLSLSPSLYLIIFRLLFNRFFQICVITSSCWGLLVCAVFSWMWILVFIAQFMLEYG